MKILFLQQNIKKMITPENQSFSYPALLKQIKARVALAQRKAIYAANEEMLYMYGDIGKLLSQSQK